MVVGASVGSTGGGVKCMRIMVILKHGYRELIRLIHPRAVIRLKLGDQVVPPEIFASIAGFIFLYLGLAAVSMFLVAASGVDLVTTISSVLACLGNIGPGLGQVGPMDNYAGVPVFAKWILCLDMLLGRLEIYTVIILLVPKFYKK
jgi:trk system potassium uptake protein TrkH